MKLYLLLKKKILIVRKMPTVFGLFQCKIKWAPSSEFVSLSIPSWQNLTAHAQPFRGARDLAFCLKVPLDSLLVWTSSEGSGETARMRRLAWTFAARIGDKYQIRLTRSKCFSLNEYQKQVMSQVAILGFFTFYRFQFLWEISICYWKWNHKWIIICIWS